MAIITEYIIGQSMKKNITDKIDNSNKVEQEMSQQTTSRRSFIKKAAYVAPTLIALGTLTRPSDAKAGPRPPSGPAW